ncbi:transposase [Leptospira weilii]|uniref:transposase n=1 Tax=Leptospira weilii TaxID=28184 RepID=UPI001F33BD68|nr:transposase [Leptospira weilii]
MARKPQYDEEFKKNTIELLIKPRKSMTQISKDLGVFVNTLINWKKKYLTDDGPFQYELRAENERLRKELMEVKEGGDLKKVRGHLLETKEMKYTFVKKNRFPIEDTCRILNVSKSGYYEWLKREDSERAKSNQKLDERIADSI